MTNSALVYGLQCGGRGSCGVSAYEYSCAHGAQINFGDLTPYLTYGRDTSVWDTSFKGRKVQDVPFAYTYVGDKASRPQQINTLFSSVAVQLNHKPCEIATNLQLDHPSAVLMSVRGGVTK